MKKFMMFILFFLLCFVNCSLVYANSEDVWNNFVNAFNNTEYIKNFISSSDDSIKVSNTSDSLIVNVEDETGNYSSTFKYENGIVSLITSEVEGGMLADSLFTYNCLLAFADFKGYNQEEFLEWFDDDKVYSLENDGIELEIVPFTSSENNDLGSFDFTFDRVKSFKLDIDNGLKNYSSSVKDEVSNKDNVSNNDDEITSKDDVNNPSTGDEAKYILLGLFVLLFVGVYSYFKSRRFNKFINI